MKISKLGLSMLGSALCLSTAISCATAPPKELVDAREKYRAVAAGPASRQAPAQLDTAKGALARAEQAFEDDPGAPETRDYAYIAQRKAELAEAKSSTEIARQQTISAQLALTTATKNKLAQTKDDLKNAQQEAQNTKVDLATSQQQNVNSAQQLADSKEQLAEEKVERQATEDKNKELISSLANLATVKEDARGTIISLSGGVLFASGQATLLPSATTALDSVATALNGHNTQNITIEGHTDSVGSGSFNQRLSRNRADAVRTYLIGKGVASERIEAVGLGSSRPVAENTTPDGRANNRRVEIVILRGQS